MGKDNALKKILTIYFILTLLARRFRCLTEPIAGILAILNAFFIIYRLLQISIRKILNSRRLDDLWKQISLNQKLSIDLCLYSISICLCICIFICIYICNCLFVFSCALGWKPSGAANMLDSSLNHTLW